MNWRPSCIHRWVLKIEPRFSFIKIIELRSVLYGLCLEKCAKGHKKAALKWHTLKCTKVLSQTYAHIPANICSATIESHDLRDISSLFHLLGISIVGSG